MYAERLALDGGLSLPTENPTYTSIISCLLEDVVNLRLKCDKYDQIELVVSMIKAAVASGQASNLNHLLIAIPDMYMEVVDPLCALFALQNFHLLSLELHIVCPLMLSKLLQAFITNPCPHTHKLLVHVKGDNWLETSSIELKKNQIAAMDMQGITIPSCGLQHKVLKFSSSNGLTRGLYLLLQYPEIRLKESTIFTDNQDLHFCATHPHFQITKLVVFVNRNATWCRKQSATLQQDIVSLFKISSLEKISVHGMWGPQTEFKLGLVLGL